MREQNFEAVNTSREKDVLREPIRIHKRWC